MLEFSGVQMWLLYANENGFYLHGAKAWEFVIQLSCGNKYLNGDVNADKERHVGTVLVFDWVFLDMCGATAS